MPDLPDNENSYWFNSASKPTYPILTEEIEVDVAVIGAGITGLSAAYMLKQAGLKVAVIDKRRVGSGTTGRTTGKVTSQHSLIYDDFKQRLGVNTAEKYAQANQSALEQIKSIIRTAKIDCDWQDDDNYVYTTQAYQEKKFKAEAEAAKSLGLPASFETTTPLPFKVVAAVKFSGQGKFNAEKYLQGLAKVIDGNGSYVFENSNAISIRDGRPGRIKTKQGTITAKNIIVATNVPTLPLVARGAYCLLEYPTESYIVMGKPATDLTGMYISPDDAHYSILPFTTKGQKFILIGGEANVSGARISKERKYKKLADYAQEHFGVTKILNKWNDRDYMTYDGPPLIGKPYPWSKNLYVGSAYRKWGLTNGTVAGIVLRDLIIGKPNPWAEIFDPVRFKPITNIPRVAAKYLLRRK